jgi:2'-5' RNA ligase
VPRRKLGVALLIPRNLAPEIDGLRRALGAPDLAQVPPHITLVLPINVRTEDVDAAITLVRDAAAAEQPIDVVIGPLETFYPVTPVLYLRVSGPGLDAITRLRDALDNGPLAQELTHPFVPHVTLDSNASDAAIAGAQASITRYVEHVHLDTITVLEQNDEDKVWRPIADAPLGVAPPTRTIGGSPVTMAVTKYPTDAGSTMGRYRSVSVEAFVDGRVVGLAHGHYMPDGVAWLDELVVIRETRGTGIGAQLARAFVDAARAAKANEVRAVRGSTIAGFLVRFGFAVDKADEFSLPL